MPGLLVRLGQPFVQLHLLQGLLQGRSLFLVLVLLLRQVVGVVVIGFGVVRIVVARTASARLL